MRPRGDLYPTLDDCNDAIEWIEDNNDIDLNEVKFRIREPEEESGAFIISIIWEHRSHDDPPNASELLPCPGWVIDKWFWNGEFWAGCIWRHKASRRTR